MFSKSLSSILSETNLISLDEDDLTISYFIQILLIFASIYLMKTQLVKNEISGLLQHLKCRQSDFLSHLMAESPFLKNLSIHLFSKPWIWSFQENLNLTY